MTRLLARPVTEGPTFFLFLDGLNQHPHTDWTGLAQTLQADLLLGRVRLLTTCRQSYFEQDLRRLSRIAPHLFEKRKVGATTQVLLRNEAAVLGLALALLETLDNRGDDFDAQQAALEEWVEPINAIDQTTEVLRAALSVISAGAGSDGEIKTDCLLVTWMNVQNPGRTRFRVNVDAASGRKFLMLSVESIFPT